MVRPTTRQVSADLRRPLVTTVARRGILKQLVGAKSNHNKEGESFKDVEGQRSELTINGSGEDTREADVEVYSVGNHLNHPILG